MLWKTLRQLKSENSQVIIFILLDKVNRNVIEVDIRKDHKYNEDEERWIIKATIP